MLEKEELDNRQQYGKKGAESSLFYFLDFITSRLLSFGSNSSYLHHHRLTMQEMVLPFQETS
jgi:hypothetical protein